MKQIFNEGRIVGLSTYELYIRQLLSNDVNAHPLSESEWLASGMSANASMILKIPSGTLAGVHDYILPVGSDLCGCSIIYASIFEGKVKTTDDCDWALGVNDYGRLVSNTATSHPETPGQPENVPAKEDPITITEDFAEQCRNYLKVTSALMFQPGTWVPVNGFTSWLTEESNQNDDRIVIPIEEGDLSVDCVPDLTQRGFIRLAIAEDITTDLLVLINGFSRRSLQINPTSPGQAVGASNPENGDFLGPALFPWACKIVLVVTTEVFNVIMSEVKVQVYAIQDTPPEDTGILWIDTGNGGVAKYYDGSEWTHVRFGWS